MRPVVLVSGGLMSSIVYRQTPDALAVYLAAGHPSQEQELVTLRALAVPIIVDRHLALADLVEADGYTIKHRNLLFATVGSLYGSPVAHGARGGKTGLDNTDAFTAACDRALVTSAGDRYERPCQTMTTGEAVAWYLRDHATADDVTWLSRTRGCYTGASATYAGCGCCANCVRRFVAFTLNGLPEERHHEDPRLSLLLREEAPDRLAAVDPANRPVLAREIAEEDRVLEMIGAHT